MNITRNVSNLRPFITLNQKISLKCYSTTSQKFISKMHNVQQHFFVIPHQHLHPDLQSIANRIKYENMARIGGSIFYPCLSILGMPSIIFWTPVCVGAHHTTIRYCYKVALESLNAGDISNDSDLNQVIMDKIITKKIARFHINYKGDIVLHKNSKKLFCISKFKGVNLLKKEKIFSPLEKINAIKHRIFPHLQSEVSFFHLEEDVQRQVKKILKARQLRFRACMGTIITATCLGTISDVLRNAISYLPLYISLGGGMQGVNFSDFKVSQHTNDLWNLIHQKKSWKEIIKLKYQNNYLYTDFKEPMYFYLSMTGNLKYSKQSYFSFRKKHLHNKVS